MTLIEQNSDIQNVSIMADPQPDNPLGFKVIVWTTVDPDSKDPEQQKRGLAVADTVQQFLKAHSPGCTGITLKRA